MGLRTVWALQRCIAHPEAHDYDKAAAYLLLAVEAEELDVAGQLLLQDVVLLEARHIKAAAAAGSRRRRCGSRRHLLGARGGICSSLLGPLGCMRVPVEGPCAESSASGEGHCMVAVHAALKKTTSSS